MSSLPLHHRRSSMEIYRDRKKNPRKYSKFPPKKPTKLLCSLSVTKMPSIYEETINKSNYHFQLVSWEILTRSISMLAKKVKNTLINDIPKIKNKLLYLNLITGKGLLCSSIMKEQLETGICNTYKFAFLMSLINVEFPEIGILLLQRCVHCFFSEYNSQPRGKPLKHGVAIITFIANLVNYGLAHPILAVDFVELFLKNHDKESIKMALIIVQICGHQMRQQCSVHLDEIANTDLNSMGPIDEETKFDIYITLFGMIRNNKYNGVRFSSTGSINYKNIHFFKTKTLTEMPSDETCDYFIYKPTCDAETYRLYYEQFILTEENRDYYLLIYDVNDSLQNETSENYDKYVIPKNMKYIKRTITSIIQNKFLSNYDTIAGDLMEIKIKPGQEVMLCSMLIELCCTLTTNTFYHVERVGYVTQMLVQLDEFLVEPLEETLSYFYLNAHTVTYDNVICISKYFASLLFSDTISWDVLSIIEIDKMDIIRRTQKTQKTKKTKKTDKTKETEKPEDTPQLSFVKTLFLELLNHLGYDDLSIRICSEFNIKAFEKIFLVDGAIEFFQSIKMEKFVDMYQQSYNSMKHYLKDN